jgi:integrase
MHFLTHAEFDRLVVACSEFYRPVILTLALTGLRWGELTGLHARHLNPAGEPATITVRQSLQRQRDGSYALGAPKTRASRRTVSIPASLATTLEPLWETRAPDAFLFTSRQRTAIRHQNFYYRVWKTAVEKAGLPADLRIHDLRHTHASWLISAGRPLPSIQRRLGHRSIPTTVDRYGHLLPEVDLGDIAALENAYAAR